MRIRFILIGIVGLILLVFALTSIVSAFYLNKKGRPTFRFYTIMLLLGILGGIAFYSPAHLFNNIEQTKPAPTILVADKSWKDSTDENPGIPDETGTKGKANAKERLFLPTGYQTIETTHPSVVNFPEKWHGYKYWMAVTAYPRADAAKENPHLFASNDMIQWSEPDKGMNPIDEPVSELLDKDNRPLQYNSDTHLIYNKEDDRLEMFWRYVDDVNNKVKIYRSESTDGISWSEKHSIYTDKRKPNDWLSPAFIKEDNTYKVWYVARDYEIEYRESNDGTTWSKPVKLDIPYNVSTPDAMHHWHMDVQKIDNHYEMIVVGFKKTHKNTLKDRHVMNLYHATSEDGKNWSKLTPIIYPADSIDAWDNKGIYRSAFIKENGKYYVFYSGIGYGGVRGVGISYGSDINNLTGVDYSYLNRLTE